jgi:soluble lytic murein transglycosylase-like protein
MALRKIVLVLLIIALVIIVSVRVGTNTEQVEITPEPTPIETLTPTVTAQPVIATPEPIVEVELITYYDCPLSYDLQDYIRTLCNEKSVSMAVIIAMIDKESSFRAEVVSATNDYGLMQINRCNHEWLSDTYGVTDFLDPYQNVLCGISILGDHLARYEDITKALMAYNMGATGAKNAWDSGVTHTAYTDTILSLMSEYEQTTVQIERSSK